jgi:hypothetical protein
VEAKRHGFLTLERILSQVNLGHTFHILVMLRSILILSPICVSSNRSLYFSFSD